LVLENHKRNLEEALFQGGQDYISKVAKTEKDICILWKLDSNTSQTLKAPKSLGKERPRKQKDRNITRTNPQTIYL
jgi:hypothetical protein